MPSEAAQDWRELRAEGFPERVKNSPPVYKYVNDMSLLRPAHENAPTSNSECTRSPEDAESHMVELNDIAIASLQYLQNFRLVFEDR